MVLMALTQVHQRTANASEGEGEGESERLACNAACKNACLAELALASKTPHIRRRTRPKHAPCVEEPRLEQRARQLAQHAAR